MDYEVEKLSMDYGSAAGGTLYGSGYESGAGSASGPGYASRSGLHASLPMIGDDILKELRPSGLSKEWDEWYEGYTVWRLEQIVLRKNKGLSYTVEPPPYRLRGDPNVVIKVKSPHWELGVFLCSVEDAVEFYNKNNPDCEIEPVEVLSGNGFYHTGVTIRHINFKAKPKIANSYDDCAQKFFAEVSLGPPWNMPFKDLPRKTEVLSCCLLEDRSTGDRCGGCTTDRRVDHPLHPSAYKAGHPAFLHRPPDTEFFRKRRKSSAEFLSR